MTFLYATLVIDFNWHLSNIYLSCLQQWACYWKHNPLNNHCSCLEISLLAKWLVELTPHKYHCVLLRCVYTQYIEKQLPLAYMVKQAFFNELPITLIVLMDWVMSSLQQHIFDLLIVCFLLSILFYYNISIKYEQKSSAWNGEKRLKENQ